MLIKLYRIGYETKTRTKLCVIVILIQFFLFAFARIDFWLDAECFTKWITIIRKKGTNKTKRSDFFVHFLHFCKNGLHANEKNNEDYSLHFDKNSKQKNKNKNKPSKKTRFNHSIGFLWLFGLHFGQSFEFGWFCLISNNFNSNFSKNFDLILFFDLFWIDSFFDRFSKFRIFANWFHIFLWFVFLSVCVCFGWGFWFVALLCGTRKGEFKAF